MAGEKSRQEWLEDMKWKFGKVDQALVVEEMETMAGHLREWAARCREGDVAAWVVLGQVHHQFWDVADALEQMFGAGGVSEAAESDG